MPPKKRLIAKEDKQQCLTKAQWTTKVLQHPKPGGSVFFIGMCVSVNSGHNQVFFQRWAKSMLHKLKVAL